MSGSHPENDDDNESREPMHAEFQHQAVTARVQPDALSGVFANAAIIQSGQFEFVIDFVIRMGKPNRVVCRVILPVPVVQQFCRALRDSLDKYQEQFGAIPQVGTREAPPESGKSAPGEPLAQGGFVGAIGPESSSPPDPELESSSRGRQPPGIEEIYDELKLEDSLLGGVYANAVLIRHSASECCFDFVTNIFPRSSVNARVFMAIPQLEPLLNSLTHSFEQFLRRQNPPEGEE